MKFVILGDLHIGARNANQHIANHHIEFFTEQLIPYMKKNGITTILQTGDLFDTRKFTNHVILQKWFDEVFDRLENAGITMHVVVGNHDIALRQSLSVNTPTLFLSDYPNIIVHSKPVEVDFDGTEVLMVPWICDENHDVCVETMKKTKSTICIGHFEFANFDMHVGQPCHDGMDHKPFKRFDTIFSGHYHTRSSRDNVKYVGTPYEMTWIDYGDTKGFHVYDTRSLDLEFIPNEKTIFNKIYYDDSDGDDVKTDYYKQFNVKQLQGSYVKVVVVGKKDPYQFDMLMDRLYNTELLDLSIVEDMSALSSDEISDDDVELENTVSLIESYVDASDIELDKDRLKLMIKTLYTEALDIMI